MKITVGTRGSLLATTQTGVVIDKIKSIIKNVEVTTKIIKTQGDIDMVTSLNKMGSKGIFVGEIEQALLDGSVDIAIHSMKDMPTEDTKGLKLLPILVREKPGDVLITKHDITSYEELPARPVIGTGSKRRAYQLLDFIEDAIVEPIRGNVDTRIRKMLEDNFDAIILAHSGVNRIGIKSCKAYKVIEIPTEKMVPAPAQGILGLQLRCDRLDLLEAMKPLIDDFTSIQATAERKFLETVEGGCHMPVGAHLEDLGGKVKFTGVFGDEEGKILVRESIECEKEDAAKVADDMAKRMVIEVKNG